MRTDKRDFICETSFLGLFDVKTFFRSAIADTTIITGKKIFFCKKIYFLLDALNRVLLIYVLGHQVCSVMCVFLQFRQKVIFILQFSRFTQTTKR